MPVRTTKPVAGPFILLLALVAAACQDAPPPRFEAARVLQHVETQCAFGPRLPNTAARDSAAAYVARTLEGYGADVRLQSFGVPDPYADRTLRLINIVASFDADRDRRVMLAAHYDSRPWADQEPDTSLHVLPIPAAVDGAAGAGLLIEIGRILGKRSPEEIGVDLVFFDGEDYGKKNDLQHYLLGSKYFATNLAGYWPEKVILVDMVGGVGTRVLREQNSVEYAGALVDTLFSRAAALGLSYFHDEPGAPMIDDHVPFLLSGLQAVDLFGYDYPHWHTLADTPDKCSLDLLDQTGRLLVDFLYRYPFR